MNQSQLQTIHTGVLSILVNFKSVFLLKKKTLQESLSVQVELNQEIKEGLILFISLKTTIKMESNIHNTIF